MLLVMILHVLYLTLIFLMFFEKNIDHDPTACVCLCSTDVPVRFHILFCLRYGIFNPKNRFSELLVRKKISENSVHRSRSNVKFSPHFRGCANPSKLLSSSSMQSENICTLNSVLLCTTLRDKMGMFGVPLCNTILIIVYLASFPLYYCCAFVTSWPQMMCTAISVVSNS